MAWGAPPHEITEITAERGEARDERRLACSCGWHGSRMYRVGPEPRKDDCNGVDAWCERLAAMGRLMWREACEQHLEEHCGPELGARLLDGTWHGRPCHYLAGRPLTHGDRVLFRGPTGWAPVLYDVLVLDDEPALVSMDTGRILPARAGGAGLALRWPA